MAEQNNNENKNQMLEEGKKVAKNKVMQKLVPWIIKISIPVILIILAGALLLGVFNAVGDVVQDIVDGIVEFFTIDPADGTITITNEQIDTIINGISDLGISIDGLKLMGDVNYDDPDVQAQNQEALRKYIKKFYEAQAVTQTLNTNPNWFEEHVLEAGELYGTVYVHRTQGEESIEPTTENQLTYIPYEDMVKKQQKQEQDITEYFSMNESGQLVIAGWTKSTVIKDDRQAVSDHTTINLINIDYRSAISQYTTSMNFFLYLTMITQNPEFVSAVTDLVKNSEIRITVLDTKSTNVETEIYTYTENTKTREEVEQITYEEWDVEMLDPQITTSYEDTVKSQQKTEKTQTTTTTVTPTAKVTYVKTWFCEQTITYNKKQENNSTTNTVTQDDEQEPQLTEEGSAKWKTNQTIKVDSKSSSTTYEEATKGNVVDRTGEKGSQGIKDTNNNGKVDGNEIVDENSTFLGLLDDEFKIPNTTRYSSAGGNLVSGAEMFFYLLQKDPESQNLEQIMRYILYKYTGNDYGVTELDFSIYEAKEFSTIGSGSSDSLLKEYIRYWENAGGAPMNADGTKYIIHDDGAGIPTVGYGVNVNVHKSTFISAGYPTEIGGEVDVEFVDSIEDTTIENYKQQVQSITSGLDLTDYQINALVSRAYNCGVSGALTVTRGSPSLNFVESYKKYWNPEEEYTNVDYSHSLYTQYMSKPDTAENVGYMAGLERRRKSEWTLFQTGYYDVLNKKHSDYAHISGDILENCVNVMNDLLANNVKYTISNLVWNNIEASNDFSKYGCCCATYVSVVLYRSGALSADFINNYNYNYTGTINESGVNGMLKAAGWTHVSESEAQAGDVCVYNGHTFIYAGGNYIWDQSSGCISSSGKAPVGGPDDLWNHYKNNYDLDVWRMP